jgi:hypothetical protein
MIAFDSLNIWILSQKFCKLDENWNAKKIKDTTFLLSLKENK